MLRVSSPALVQIIGTRVAISGDYQDRWREVAGWTAQKLKALFGEAVRVEYFDLFDPGCPALPANAELPLVLVEGEMLSQGDRISIPAIRKRLEELGVAVKTSSGAG